MNITALTPNQAIRKRPTMYVGPLDDSKLLSNLVLEGCCVAFADAKRGLVKNIEIAVISDTVVSIKDDGPGWNTAERKGGKPIPVSIMQDLYACREMKDSEDEEFCKIGISVANALSDYCRLSIFKTLDHEFFGVVHEYDEYEFERGELTWFTQNREKDEPIDSDSVYGTVLFFKFDTNIIETKAIDIDYLRDKTAEVSCSYGVNIVVKDRR